jgi:hypothetical protein
MSKIRDWTRSRLSGFAWQADPYMRPERKEELVNGWLSDFMQTPELSLREYAEQHGGTLAVIDTSRQYHPVPEDADGATYYAVVKMEGETDGV